MAGERGIGGQRGRRPRDNMSYAEEGEEKENGETEEAGIREKRRWYREMKRGAIAEKYKDSTSKTEEEARGERQQ